MMRQVTFTIVVMHVISFFLCNQTLGEVKEIPTIPSSSTNYDDTLIEFKTEKEFYKPGEEVLLILQNNSKQVIGLNLCFSTLQQKFENNWIPAEHQQDHACIAIIEGLLSGGTAYYKHRLSDRLPEGTYCFKTEIEFQGKMIDYRTNDFLIAKKISSFIKKLFHNVRKSI